MEIKDYLKVLGKRAWLLVMIPAVAGVVAGLIAVRQPQAFRTTATLQLPHDAEASPAEVAQLVADFRAAADNPTVQNQVAEDTGVPIKRIKRLKITQVGDSSQLTLSIQDKKRSATDSKAVIEGLTTGALGYLEAPEARAAEKSLDAANDKIETAQDDLTTANTDLNALYVAVQSGQPEEDLKAVKTDKSQFTQGLARELAAGNTAGAQTYREFVALADARIAALNAAVPTVQVLRLEADDAQTALTAAQAERETATQLLIASSAEPDLTFSAEGQAVVRKTRVVKTAAAAVVAGFPIAVGVVLLLDALQKRRERRAARPTDDEDFDDDVVDHVESAPTVAPALIGASVGSAGASGPLDDQVDRRRDTTVYVHADDHIEPAEDDDLDDLDDLDDEDLDDDLDDELDEDVEAAVASRRRMYEADIDDDLSVDGGHADRNGQGRVWARVPATDEDFDGDDEGASADH